MNTSASAPVIYREYLRPSINTIIAIALIWPTIWLTVFPWDVNLGGWIGLVLELVAYAFAFAKAPSIVVTAEFLSVGDVAIPRSELGTAVALAGTPARLARGPDLDPKAFVLFRGTNQTLVRVPVVSASDPTPYWLFSSRSQERLAAALNG